jgi:hypothetical protein
MSADIIRKYLEMIRDDKHTSLFSIACAQDAIRTLVNDAATGDPGELEEHRYLIPRDEA